MSSFAARSQRQRWRVRCRTPTCSRCESFGSVILEALASGTAIVATRSGGPEDIVTEEVGRVVPVDDPAALAVALEQVLEERSRFEPSRLRAYALERFSWDRVAVEYLDIYRQAIAGTNARSPTAVQQRSSTA